MIQHAPTYTHTCCTRPTVLALVALVSVACYGCNSPQALVNISYPKDYHFNGKAHVKTDEAVSIYLNKGVHSLPFNQNGKVYYVILEVRSGGEMYVVLNKSDFHSSIRVEEGKDTLRN